MKKIALFLVAAIQIMTFSTVVADIGHHHESESCECQFKIPFHKDRLSATVELALESGTKANAEAGPGPAPVGTITPYVSHPNGFVHVGKPVLISDLPLTAKFPTVHPAVTGTYTYGILVSGTGVDNNNDILPVTITSSLTGVSTTTYILFRSSTLTTIQSQYNTSFVYNLPSLP